MSVSLLTLSPLARGLFRRAIAESGNVFCGDIVACAPEKAAKHLFASVPKKFPGWYRNVVQSVCFYTSYRSLLSIISLNGDRCSSAFANITASPRVIAGNVA
jgi:Carboxylesterase family